MAHRPSRVSRPPRGATCCKRGGDTLNQPEQAWLTLEGTYLVPQAFAPLHDSYGNPIVRADGTVLAVATTYAELTSTGEVLRVYGGPFRYYSPQETLINGIFEVVGGALHQYEWCEQERPAPGSLTDRVVREGLVAEHRVSPLFGSTPLKRDAS